jgi:hypothetical protein
MKAAPLAIVFFGVGARTAFDVALDLQSKLDAPHVMTKRSASGDLSEAIDDLLHATWPSEDRFDEWETYSILVVGGGWSIEEVCEEVKSAIG